MPREFVTKRSILPSRLKSAAAIPIPAFGSATPSCRATLLEPESELSRIGLGASGPGDVLVELVRIRVVRDVQVEPSVAVEISEHRSEAVTDLSPLDAGCARDFAERRVAVGVRSLVEVEEVAHGAVVRREARCRWDRGVDVRVGRDEEIRPPITVYVADRRAGVPAERVDPGLAGAFGERPVSVVPEQRIEPVGGHVVLGGRHVQIRVAVEVEVRCNAAVPAEREIGAGVSAHVLESPTDVAEERALGKTALRLPGEQVGGRVRVDDEQVEPAVVVVVEPAQAAAHHGRGVARHAEAERALTEVEADLARDVNEGRAAERATTRRAGRSSEREAALGRDDAIRVAVELQLDGAAEAHGIAAAHERRRRPTVRRGHEVPWRFATTLGGP